MYLSTALKKFWTEERWDSPNPLASSYLTLWHKCFIFLTLCCRPTPDPVMICWHEGMILRISRSPKQPGHQLAPENQDMFKRSQNNCYHYFHLSHCSYKWISLYTVLISWKIPNVSNHCAGGRFCLKKNNKEENCMNNIPQVNLNKIS